MEGERGGWAEGAGGVAAVGFGRLSGLNLSQQGLLQYLGEIDAHFHGGSVEPCRNGERFLHRFIKVLLCISFHIHRNDIDKSFFWLNF